MNGRKVHVTMLGYPSEWGCGVCGEFEREIRRQLKAIGITVTIRRASDYPADAFQSGTDFDLVAHSTDSGTPDPVGLLGSLREDTWLGDAVHRSLARLENLSGQARIDQAVGFVDEVVHQRALVIPYGRPIYPFYVADRIGCGFVQPAIGAVDLLSLCIR